APEHGQFRVTLGIVAAGPAPEPPAAFGDRRQGAHAVPLHLEQVIFGIEGRRRGCQHGVQEVVHALALRARGLRPLPGAGVPLSAVATLCCKASRSCKIAAGSSAGAGGGWSATLACSKAANSSALVSR